MRFFLKGLSLLLLCIIMQGVSLAQFVVPDYQGYITDYANVLSSDDISNLTEKITSLEKETGIEIAILFVSTINDDDIAFAATDVGQTRGVGKEKQDNGIVVLVAVEDRQRFIAVGYGLEGTIPDAIAKRIGDRYFPDYFRAGDYAGGIAAAIDDISGYILADPSIISSYDDYNNKHIGLDTWVLSVIVALIFLSAVWLPKEKKLPSKSIKTAVWIGFVIVVSLFVASIALGLLFVSFLGLFFLIKTGTGMYMGGGRSGGFGGGGFGGGGFGGFGGGGFGGGGGGGRR